MGKTTFNSVNRKSMINKEQSLKCLLTILADQECAKSEKDQALATFIEMYWQKVLERCVLVSRTMLPDQHIRTEAERVCAEIIDALYFDEAFTPQEDESEKDVTTRFFQWVKETVAGDLNKKCKDGNLPKRGTISGIQPWTRNDSNETDDGDSENDPEEYSVAELVLHSNFQINFSGLKTIDMAANGLKSKRDKDIYRRMIKPFGGDLKDVPGTVRRLIMNKWEIPTADALKSAFNRTKNRLKKSIATA